MTEEPSAGSIIMASCLVHRGAARSSREFTFWSIDGAPPLVGTAPWNCLLPMVLDTAEFRNNFARWLEVRGSAQRRLASRSNVGAAVLHMALLGPQVSAARLATLTHRAIEGIFMPLYVGKAKPKEDPARPMRVQDQLHKTAYDLVLSTMPPSWDGPLDEVWQSARELIEKGRLTVEQRAAAEWRATRFGFGI